MIHTATHRFGTSNYESTLLEDFVARLADGWRVVLADLSPAQSVSYGPFLERKGSREGDDAVSIWYTRNPSNTTQDMARQMRHSADYMKEVTPHLYADNSPRSEFAHLKKRNRGIVMHFGDGLKKVTIKVPEVAEALARAHQEAPIYGIDKDEHTVVELDFNATAHRKKRDDA